MNIARLPLPDHYPFAAASTAEVLSWIATDSPPYARIREAVPWLHGSEQVDWYVHGLREALNRPELCARIGEWLQPAPRLPEQ